MKIVLVTMIVSALLASPSITRAEKGPTQFPEARVPAGVTAEMLPIGTIKMQVFRAGKTGLPIVLVQDMHNYFAEGQPFDTDEDNALWERDASEYKRFVQALGHDFSVFVPIRRGYGETENPGMQYQGAIYAEDMLSMLDVYGIERAVFFGRLPAQNILYWLAEHHPDRMLGMVLLDGTPNLPTDLNNPDVFDFMSSWWRGAKDVGETDAEIDRKVVRGSTQYAPHFLTENQRSDIPLLYFEAPPFIEGKWFEARLFARELAAADCPEPTATYPCNFFGFPEKVERVRKYFEAHPNVALAASAQEKVRETYTDFTLIPFDDTEEMIDGWEWVRLQMLPFLERISAKETIVE